jgi:hypothetical protein
MSEELCPIGVKLGTDVLSLANRLLKNPITGIARGYWPTSFSFNTSLGLEDVQFQSRLRTAPVVGRIYVISDRLIHLQVAPSFARNLCELSAKTEHMLSLAPRRGRESWRSRSAHQGTKRWGRGRARDGCVE